MQTYFIRKGMSGVFVTWDLFSRNFQIFAAKTGSQSFKENFSLDNVLIVVFNLFL